MVVVFSHTDPASPTHTYTRSLRLQRCLFALPVCVERDVMKLKLSTLLR